MFRGTESTRATTYSNLCTAPSTNTKSPSEASLN